MATTTLKIERANSISGWMTREELFWLAEQASTKKMIAEIGCYVGRSTRVMADNTDGKIYAFDDFYGCREAADVKPDGTPFTDHDRETIYGQFMNNLMDHIDREKVVPIQCDFGRIPSNFEDLKFDMVFIDGDHSYEAVKRDIRYWGSRMVPGGLLCGHDCNYPPVRQAVSELLQNISYAPTTCIWYVTK